MKYDSSQFSNLMETVGQACDNKDLSMVIDALAISLANVGVSCNIPYDDFLPKILKIITSVYVISDINSSSVDESQIH